MNLQDRIHGCFMGYAVGDALGKGTEFMSAAEIAVRYPGGLRHYEQIIRDAHRSQWDKNDFTLDTDIVLLLAECIMKNERVSVNDFASTLYEWQKKSPFEIDSIMRMIIRTPGFINDPIETSRHINEVSGNREARNEALGRALLLGTLKEGYHRHIARNCRSTHFDSRCVSSALVIGEMAHQLLWNGREAEKDILIEIGRQVDERTIPYIETAYNGTLEDFDLDDESTYWYTRKAMGVALWAIIHEDKVENALYRIVDCGGDADTNASLAMGLMGLKFGVEAIPAELREKLLQKERVEDCAARWATFIEK